MNRWTWTQPLALVAALCLAAGVGCGDDSGDDDASDDGASATPDAGAAPGTSGASDDASDAGSDAGTLVWMPMDAGASETGETPPPGPDPDDPLAGRQCAQVRMPLPDQLTPRCSAVTRDCIASCMEEPDPDTCREQCLEADDTPPEPNTGLDCPGCVYLSIFACIDAANCHDGVAEFFCCLEDRCSGPNPPDNCGEALCGDELTTAITCGYFANESCVSYLGPEVGVCFAEGDADGGV
jgi:hypothetical protein